mgnify:CR=1 FL=1
MNTPFCYSDRDLAERYRISRQSVWRWARIGKLPKPRSIGENSTRWLASEVHEAEQRWLQEAS